jgi:hypothetical protein
MELGAVAVDLDFVQPFGAFRRLLAQRRGSQGGVMNPGKGAGLAPGMAGEERLLDARLNATAHMLS